MKAASRNALKLGGVVVAMFGFGFALVPMYDALCKALGIGGQLRNEAAATASAEVDTSRRVTVEFLTTVNGGRNWAFAPEQARIEVHPGKLYTVNFRATNAQDQAAVAQAIPQVAPWDAARHLRKTECFCFNRQPFEAGEEKLMPVVFMLDPALPKDVDTVTLSYTFYDVTEVAQNQDSEPRS